MAEDDSPFGRIPSEVISEIFDLIPIRDKKKARLVCHRWRLIIDVKESIVFRPKITNVDSFKHYLKSYREMDQVILRNVNKRMSKVTAPEHGFPVIKSAQLGWNNSQGNIVKFLKEACEFAESLTIMKFSLERISRSVLCRIIPEINWNHLTRFALNVEMKKYKAARARKHLGNAIALLKLAQIETLTDFYFSLYFRYGFSRKRKLRFENVILAFYQFLAGHSGSLTNLSIWMTATSKRSLEIPEVPKNLETLLDNRLKLKTCNLGFRGVRYLECLLKPEIFGPELTDLDLSFSTSRWESEEALSLALLPLIEPVLGKNGRTLKNLYIHVPKIHMAWFESSPALEVLRFNCSDIAESEGFAHPDMRLKSFDVPDGYISFAHPGFRQLLCQSARSLEQLTLDETQDHIFDGPNFWFLDCTALKSLNVANIWPICTREGTRAHFPSLTELETLMTPQNVIEVTAWIAKCMPNLEKITIKGDTCIPTLQTLLQISNLKKIILQTPFFRLNRECEALRHFCEDTPGLSMRFCGRYYYQTHTISVDRPWLN